MTKAEKAKAPQHRTKLEQLATRLRAALKRETVNAVVIGKLLIESRNHLDHGEWQPWLAKNFDLSYRTALNYVSAAEYVARKGKSETVSLSTFVSLSPVVLYRRAADHYDEQEEAAILAAAHEGRVDQDAADAICEKLATPDDDVVDDADDADDEDPADGTEALDPEIEAILDGPPPAVPPPPPILPPTNFALRDFDQAIGTLKRLMTKSSAQFDGTTYTIDDLEKVKSFICAVMKAKAAERQQRLAGS